MLRVLWTTLLLAVLQVAAYKFERIDKNDAALLIVDHQVGLLGAVRDYNAQDIYNNIILHATFGKTYNLPVVITTSADQGPNGPLLPEIVDMYPNVTVVRRSGEINAWDNPDFRAAVKATGKKQVIVGGIATDVCTMFVSLSLLEAGYTVFANADASGTLDTRAADLANARMRDAGVYVMPQFAVASDLQRDWRSDPGVATFLDLLVKFFPTVKNVVMLHGGSVKGGVLIPGEDELI